ncbi:MAG TPA: formyltetrahydrofolate deformylase [Verrucomicrobiota bacterium]|nr:formyltetrahydrofolate deformylase [Verrucomicrobiota bacterium]
MKTSAELGADSARARILQVECDDRPGLVHGITGILFSCGVNVVGNQEFVDRAARRFFMRTEFDGVVEPAALEIELRTVLPAGARVELCRSERKRVVVLASKEHHCLADILVRHEFHELNADVVAVIANHTTLEQLVQRFGIPFQHVPSGGTERAADEKALRAVIDSWRPDFLVLAKYMRILSAEFVARFPARIINIHHSFLPAFAGARPYHQAYQRGVKVIGATAHFVTDDLDAGPIIVQQVVPVDHTHAVEDLVRSGRDVEQMVLARALRLVFEDRVFLCGNRTVVFD